jgi:hypothetical protein
MTTATLHCWQDYREGTDYVRVNVPTARTPHGMRLRLRAIVRRWERANPGWRASVWFESERITAD